MANPSRIQAGARLPGRGMDGQHAAERGVPPAVRNRDGNIVPARGEIAMFGLDAPPRRAIPKIPVDEVLAGERGVQAHDREFDRFVRHEPVRAPLDGFGDEGDIGGNSAFVDIEPYGILVRLEAVEDQ